MNNPTASDPNAIINGAQLRELIPVSPMTIWRWEKAGDFPKHFQINNHNYWRLSEVLNWIDAQQHQGAA